MISAEPSSLSDRFYNISPIKRLRAKFPWRKQHRPSDHSPETHQQPETSHGHGPPSPPSRHDTDFGPPPKSTPVPPFPDGVEVLHDCRDAAVDICFIHGLTGNRARLIGDPRWPIRLGYRLRLLDRRQVPPVHSRSVLVYVKFSSEDDNSFKRLLSELIR
ncbi:NACHT-sigma domain-containing protein [Fusarium sp. LHS14.1]|nr:NACHT-sigma domain-containing protein [Fusarium sp. LHS14.1]